MHARRLLAALALACTATVAFAQAYPSRPVKLIVPFPPGGGTDIYARVVANKLGEANKWAVIVENKPGAGGNIGVDAAAKSAPDGYTMVVGQTSNLAIAPSLYAKLPYDPLKDLVPVALLGTGPVAIVVRANSPYKTLKDLLDAARANPGVITFATPGNGTVAHLTGVRLQKAAGVKLEHIPYKGTARAIPDVLNGSVDAYLASVPSVQPQVAAGAMRALAVTSAKRSPILPDVPSVADTFPGFDAVTWFGILMPAGTPAAVVARMNEAINAALKSPDVRAKIAADGGDVLGGSPEDFAKVLRADIASWSAIVRESGAKVD
ncbi:MAG TPA: tripartite tricarboxylate transporter substrate binding protein [Casimicrobiaceae bacterium]